MIFSVVQPWTLDVFSAFTSLTELRIGLSSKCGNDGYRVLKLTESLLGLSANLCHVACKQNPVTHCTCAPVISAHGLSAGLQKLQHLELHGSLDHSVAEEKPGLLNKVLEGLFSLHLRAAAMRCSDIASPNLRCLTVIMRDRDELGRLPGAVTSMQRPHKAQPEATDWKRTLLH